MKKVTKKDGEVFEQKLKEILDRAKAWGITVTYCNDTLEIIRPKGGAYGIYIGDGTEAAPMSNAQRSKNMDKICDALTAIKFWRDGTSL